MAINRNGKLFSTVFVLWLFSFSNAEASNVPKQAFIDGVPANAQSYSLSCEARSAVDWASFWGVKIREKRFLKQLPRSDNPEKGFVGDPLDTWGNIPPNSYGVHAGPVAKLLRQYGLDAKVHKGLTWEELQIEIANNQPVIVWVIGQMWKGIPTKYVTSNGTTIIVARYEHTMIVVGYDKYNVYAVDAYYGKIKKYTQKAFMQSWRILGNTAITGKRNKEQVTLIIKKGLIEP